MDIVSEILNNKYFVSILTVITLLYASLAKPNLPVHTIKIFESPYIKIIFYSIIVFFMTKNFQVALVTSIAFYVLMSMLREQRIAEGFIEGLRT